MAARTSSGSVPKDSQRYHADFIQCFTRREKQKGIANQPKLLTVAQHAILCDQLKEVRFLKPNFADNTKVNIAGILRKWKKCVTPLSWPMDDAAKCC